MSCPDFRFCNTIVYEKETRTYSEMTDASKITEMTTGILVINANLTNQNLGMDMIRNSGRTDHSSEDVKIDIMTAKASALNITRILRDIKTVLTSTKETENQTNTMETENST